MTHYRSFRSAGTRYVSQTAVPSFLSAGVLYVSQTDVASFLYAGARYVTQTSGSIKYRFKNEKKFSKINESKYESKER